jgi:hypothetical protein
VQSVENRTWDLPWSSVWTNSSQQKKTYFTLMKTDIEIFLICKEIQMGSVAKSYIRKGFLIYEEMRKYLTINEEAVSHI